MFLDNYKDLNEKTIKEYAKKVGLDENIFKKATDDPSLNNIINQDIKLGSRLKVRGVPTLFINGRRIKNRSLNALTEMIEKCLKNGE